MFIEPLVIGPWQANCFVISANAPDARTRQPAIVIDPGVNAVEAVNDSLARHHFDLAAVVCTHGHIDHVGDAARIANERGVPVYLHPADTAMLTEPALGLGPGSEVLIAQLLGTTRLPAPDDRRELAHGVSLVIAGIELEVVHAPGHSPGCVVLRGHDDDGAVLFSGDVLFAGSIGRVDLPGGSMVQMRSSLRRLRAMIDERTAILPGHGPATTMARELVMNPYLTEEALA